ncbi:MAG: HWE histidine kinase domain-containing protein [Phenylobacterium sp.]
MQDGNVISGPAFLAGGGEMGDRIRRFDWAATPLGAPETWPEALQSAVRLILATRQPMLIWWGEALIQIYNSAYAAVLGSRHPAWLGRPGKATWGERWPFVEPGVHRALAGRGGPVGEAWDLAPLGEGEGVLGVWRGAAPPARSQAASIIAAISEGCVVLDDTLVVREINPEGLRMDGREAEQIVGQRYSEAWPNLVGTAFETAYREVVATGSPVQLQHHFVDERRDAWLDVRLYPVEAGVAFFFRDVTESKRAADALRESEARLRLAQEAGSVGAYEWNLKTGELYASDVARRLWGVPLDQPVTMAYAVTLIHPDDRPYSMPMGNRPLEEMAGAAEYRIVRPDTGEIRWMFRQVELVRGEDGRPERVVGALLDITERKRLVEHQQLLINELNHRVKNTLATVQSILHQTLRRGHSPEELKALFTSRLLALSSAHDVLTRANWESADLRDIVTGALTPFQAAERRRFETRGPKVELAPGVALAIAMALHELATNAAKYGALSGLAGEVRLDWKLVGEPATPSVELVWREVGGPPVTAPAARGFGSRLLQQGLAAELGAPAQLEYRADGLICRIRWEQARQTPAL